MFLLYASVFVRAAADVVLFAYLPFHLHRGLGDGHFGLISLFIAVPAGVRFFTAPMWGKKVSETGCYGRFIVAGLGAYAIILILLPRLAEPIVGLIVLTGASLITSAFSPASKTWLTLKNDRSGLLRLATWHQWESAGYFVSGTVFGLILSDVSFLVHSATVLAIFIGVCMVLLLSWLPTSHSTERRAVLSKASLDPGPRRGQLKLDPRLVIFFLLSSLGWEAVAGTFGLYFVHTLGATLTVYGLILSASTFVGLVCYRPFARVARSHSVRSILFVSALGYSAMYLLMTSSSVAVVGIAYLLPLSGVVRTGVNMWLTDHVDGESRGAAFGVIESTEAAAAVLGTVLGGLCADRFGLASVPTVALASTVALYVLVINRRSRKHA